MRNKLIHLVVCPVCKNPLSYQRSTNEMICIVDDVAFPINKGVPVLLEMDARRLKPDNNATRKT